MTAGRPCSICSHPDRQAIEAALLAGGESVRALARNFGVTRQALERHRDNHMGNAGEAPTKAPPEGEPDPADQGAELARRIAEHEADCLTCRGNLLRPCREAAALHRLLRGMRR